MEYEPISDGGQVFPVPAPNSVCVGARRGISLRDWFAAQVLKSACEDHSAHEAATLAYQYADAMLAARGAKCN